MNLASRLEALNKRFGTLVLMSGDVRNLLEGKYDLIHLGKVRVYGRETSIPVFTAFPDPVEAETVRKWEEGLSLLSERRWDEASSYLRAAADVEPRIRTASNLYLGLIEEWRISDPGSSWDGSVTFSTKV